MQRLYSLQALRAYAASLVLIDHLIIETAKWQPGGRESSAAWVLGAFGVDIFFVISGFIMYWISKDRFGSDAYARRFIVDRLTRVVPLYWLFTLIWFFADPERARSTGDLVKALLFIPSADPAGGGVFPILSVGWTLNFEMLFYAIFACFLPFRARRAIPGIIATFAGLVGLRMAWGAAGGGKLPVIAEFYTRPMMLFFLAGVLIGLARRFMQERRIDVPLPGKTLLLGAVTLGYALYVLAANQAMHQSALADGVYKLLAIVLVAVAVLVREPRHGAADLALAKLGDASYSLYLSHILVAVLASRIWVSVIGPVAPAAFVIAGAIVAIVVALAAHRWLERPLTALVRARVDRRGMRPTVAMRA